MTGATIKLDSGLEAKLTGEQLQFLLLGYLLAVAVAHPGRDLLGATSSAMLADVHSDRLTDETCGALQSMIEPIIREAFSKEECNRLGEADSIQSFILSDPADLDKVLNQIFGG